MTSASQMAANRANAQNSTGLLVAASETTRFRPPPRPLPLPFAAPLKLTIHEQPLGQNPDRRRFGHDS
jgi:hypothetical protein